MIYFFIKIIYNSNIAASSGQGKILKAGGIDNPIAYQPSALTFYAMKDFMKYISPIKKICMTGAFLPKSLIKKINTETFLLVEINRYLQTNTNLPTTQYLGWFFKKSSATITQLINNVVRKGWLEKVNLTDKQVFIYLKNKNTPSYFGCLFCNLFDIPLDNHHYPIRKKDGGNKTILLCSNCHRRFHSLADNNFKITNKFRTAFNMENI